MISDLSKPVKVKILNSLVFYLFINVQINIYKHVFFIFKDFQIRRHTTFGLELKFNIFDNAGKIYISNSCESPAKLLRRLVHACGGHCTSIESIANVVVGYTLQMNNNIHEKWILDCITQGVLLNKCQYNLVNSNE